MGAGNTNSGPHIYEASTLLTEPSPQTIRFSGFFFFSVTSHRYIPGVLENFLPLPLSLVFSVWLSKKIQREREGRMETRIQSEGRGRTQRKLWLSLRFLNSVSGNKPFPCIVEDTDTPHLHDFGLMVERNSLSKCVRKRMKQETRV